jgi:carbohydrate-selective porin OprB
MAITPDGQVERLSGLEIDQKFVRGRLHNRIGRFFAFENLPDVGCAHSKMARKRRNLAA